MKNLIILILLTFSFGALAFQSDEVQSQPECQEVDKFTGECLDGFGGDDDDNAVFEEEDEDDYQDSDCDQFTGECSSGVVLFKAAVSPYKKAEQVALNYLKTDDVFLGSKSKKSYFFVNSYSYGNDDFPCVDGVVVDKVTLKVIGAKEDASINLNLPYSDTYIKDDGIIVINCAD